MGKGREMERIRMEKTWKREGRVLEIAVSEMD